MTVRRYPTCACSLFALLMALTLLLPVSSTAFAQRPALHGVLQACKVATKAEAAAALGGQITKIASSHVAEFSSCSFETKNYQHSLILQVATTASLSHFYGHSTTAASIFSQSKASFPTETHGVSGVGRKAFWGVAYGETELWVLKGDVVSSSEVRVYRCPKA